MEEHRRLSHVADLVTAASDALTLIDGENSACAVELLARAAKALCAASRYDSSLVDITKLLESCEIQLAEATAELRRYVSRSEADPERLAVLDSQMTQLHDLGRKHRVAIHDLPERRRQLED